MSGGLEEYFSFDARRNSKPPQEEKATSERGVYAPINKSQRAFWSSTQSELIASLP